jgi:hypothetical protein
MFFLFLYIYQDIKIIEKFLENINLILFYMRILKNTLKYKQYLNLFLD